MEEYQNTQSDNHGYSGHPGHPGYSGYPGYPDYPNTMEEEEDDDDFDIIGWLKTIWAGRKTIFTWLAIFTVIGFAVALLKPKRYEVEAIIVPTSSNSTKTSSLSSLAALAGFSLDMTTGSELSPLIYPKIASSVPFKLQLLKAPLHYEEFDEPVAMMDYKEKHVPTTAEKIGMYTIGLPGTIMKALSEGDEDTIIHLPEDGSKPDYYILTKKEARMCKRLDKNITLTVDKKEGFLTLNVIASESRVAAELGQYALNLLQDEITRFKVESSQAQLDFVQKRFDEVKAETEALQEEVARFTDKSKGLIDSYSQLEKMRVQNKYNVSNSVYQELAKQLEQSKLRVKTDTPTFSVIKPIVEPTEDMDSGLKTLIVCMFLGAVIGCGIVVAKEYLKGLKEKNQKTENATEKEEMVK